VVAGLFGRCPTVSGRPPLISFKGAQFLKDVILFAGFFDVRDTVS
jgi:hypothetical protein